jgi:hypothetical protein
LNHYGTGRGALGKTAMLAIMIGVIAIASAAAGLTILKQSSGTASTSTTTSSTAFSSNPMMSTTSSSTSTYFSSSSTSAITSETNSSSTTSSVRTWTGSSSSYQNEQLQVKATLPLSDNQFAYDSSNGYMYAINSNPNGEQGNVSGDYVVSVLDDDGLVTNITTPCVTCFYRLETVSGGIVTSLQEDYLTQVTYNPITKNVYAFEYYENAKNTTEDTIMHVINISTNTVVANYEYKQIYPIGVTSDTANSNVYAYTFPAENGNVTLLAIDGNNGAIEETVNLGSTSGPGAIAYDPINGNVYTTGGQAVNTLDYQVANIGGIGSDFNLVTVDTANNFVYYGWTTVILCCTPRSASLQIVNGTSNSVVTYNQSLQNSSGSLDTQIVYDSQSGNIYASSVAGNGTSTISVVSYATNSVLQSITTSNNIQVLAYDQSYNLFYGVDGSGNVVIASIS